MLRYIFRNISSSAINIITVVIFTFLLMNILPSDPVLIRLGARYNEKDAKALKEKYGLDKPLYFQMYRYFINVLKGEFGISIISGERINELLEKRFSKSFLLILISFLFSLPFIPLGIYVAYTGEKSTSMKIEQFFIMLSSIPLFALSSLIIFTSSFLLKISLTSRTGVPGLENYILPAFILSITPSFLIFKTVKDTMTSVLKQTFILAHRSFGFDENKILFKFALKNCAIPVITLLGNLSAYYLSMIYVVEYMFSIGGIGTLAVSSALNYDTPVVIAIVIVVSIIYNTVNIFTKLLIPILDRRVLYESL
ncbi:peptide/nickel transport system permease protein [Candidatus Kryptobacter tengchongensis]|nr:peptide/nickel transport system permease protein [Candidatus Kryptobacter tengchongensis]